jgi:hypothetical protein
MALGVILCDTGLPGALRPIVLLLVTDDLGCSGSLDKGNYFCLLYLKLFSLLFFIFV